VTPDNRDLATTDQFTELEKRDEDQILAELQGKVIEEMFYETKDGKIIVSWVGIKEIARRYGGISMSDPKDVVMQDLGEIVLIMVKATDIKNGYSMLGSSTQGKMMDVHDLGKDGRWIKDSETGRYLFHKEPDPFVYPKALSKSQRNAIRALIPETYFAKMIEEWRKGVGKPPLPPAKTQPSSTASQKKEKPKVIESTAKVKEEPALVFQSAAELPKVPDDFRPCEEAGYAIDFIVENFEQKPEIIRALVWKTMNAVEPHLTDIEAVKAVRKEFEERRKPAEPTGTESDIVYNALQEAALDGEMIVVVEPGKMATRFKKGSTEKREFLGDRFHDYNDVLKKLGYVWTPAGPDSHWEKGS